MKTNEYFKTIVVYGKMVNVGMDDPGQQYFLEYVNDNGELVEMGCGAYNFDYEEVAKWCIDTRRAYIEFYGEEEVARMEKEREERMKRYEEEDKLKEKQNDTNI